MNEYVELDAILDLIFREIDGLDSIEKAVVWYKSGKLKEYLVEELLSEDIPLDIEDIYIEKIKLLQSMLKFLSEYEKDHEEVQLLKFQQLNKLRDINSLFTSVETLFTGESLNDEVRNIDLRKCAYPPCGKTFVTSTPTKLYCGEACREKAKKWRKRHNHVN